jgi:hypothetical protein
MLSDPPKGRAETAAEKAANATTSGIVQIKKSALSIDVGPRVIAEMFGDYSRISDLVEETHKLESAANEKRYYLQADLTMAIVKAAKADDSIDLSVSFTGDKKAITNLNDQIGIALGFRESVGVKDKTGVEFQRVEYARAVKDYFPMTGEDKETRTYQRKNTFRGNFLTRLKQCVQAAHAIIEEGMDAKIDPKARTLLLSGPAVRKHFGQDRVLLNEKRTIGEGDGKVELAAKPSFTEIASIGGALAGVQPAEGAGGVHHRGKQAGTVGGTLVKEAAKAVEATKTPTGKESVADAIVKICEMLRRSLDNAKELSKAAIEALEEVQNAIEVRLAN